MGGVHPPFTIFFDFRLHSLRYEKYFFPLLSKLSQASMVKIFHFSDEWKVVSVAPQRGVYTPPKFVPPHLSWGYEFSEIGRAWGLKNPQKTWG